MTETHGMTERRTNRRIYFDANAFIYAVEGVDEISVLLRSLFEALRRQASYACTSEFTLAEVLPKTFQRRNYLTLILHSGLICFP
jgi:predicted nucleic acid-binding protein